MQPSPAMGHCGQSVHRDYWQVTWVSLCPLCPQTPGNHTPCSQKPPVGLEMKFPILPFRVGVGLTPNTLSRESHALLTSSLSVLLGLFLWVGKGPHTVVCHSFASTSGALKFRYLIENMSTAVAYFFVTTFFSSNKTEWKNLSFNIMFHKPINHKKPKMVD